MAGAALCESPLRARISGPHQASLWVPDEELMRAGDVFVGEVRKHVMATARMFGLERRVIPGKDLLLVDNHGAELTALSGYQAVDLHSEVVCGPERELPLFLWHPVAGVSQATVLQREVADGLVTGNGSIDLIAGGPQQVGLAQQIGGVAVNAATILCPDDDRYSSEV